MVIALATKPGINGANTLSIPKDWDAAWFRSFIANSLKGADVRNAVGANGISVSGNISSPYATIGLGSSTTGITVGSPTGGNEGAGTINVSGGYYLNGVNQFQSGTFTGTLGGVSGTVTGTFHYAISGNICTVSLANGTNVLGTSNAVTFSVTGLPAVCQPATQTPFCPCAVEDNSSECAAFALVGPGSGTIQFYKAVVSGSSVNPNGTGFTATGQKGLNSTLLVYSLQ